MHWKRLGAALWLRFLMGVLQRMMMKTNMLLEMRHLCSMGMPVYSRLHKVGTIQKIVLGCF